MNKKIDECSPDFQQFLQQVETALIKSAAEARRIAEQTGTKLIIYENPDRESCDTHSGNAAAVKQNEKNTLRDDM
ncbi:hypothetical protein LJC09_03235 [Desulfovibrio sp. OttesenSCG-928-F20]|nr:hypothetical protein [Desulfovibrio sp. OttesenSCG-928-M16]MDL2291096.1 hypothetical protein [Desulfovibrio sp. OttesenSCG-928-F20]